MATVRGEMLFATSPKNKFSPLLGISAGASDISIRSYRSKAGEITSKEHAAGLAFVTSPMLGARLDLTNGGFSNVVCEVMAEYLVIAAPEPLNKAGGLQVGLSLGFTL